PKSFTDDVIKLNKKLSPCYWVCCTVHFELNLILSLLFDSGWIFVSGSEVHTVTVQPGEDVTLQCSNISTSPTHTEWFRVIDTTKTSCISSMFGFHSQASFCAGFKNEKFKMSSSVTSVFLKITQVGLSDVGLYFCGFYMDVHIIISNAVELRFEGKLSLPEMFQCNFFAESERMIHPMNIIPGSLTGLLIILVIILVLKIKTPQTGKVAFKRQFLWFSDDLNYAAMSIQTKLKRSRRPATHRELESHVVYAATR
uniref:Ig-like domain-containing protein n=1 Tax=Maylandia zebra TaxID=106582 RepID=A0A3P9BG36_9CICH